ncbi:unnamed protein product [Agarophyton chilense]
MFSKLVLPLARIVHAQNDAVSQKRGETETIFNDPTNENKAASADAVTRAIYTSVALCVVSAVLLVAWWYHGNKRVDRDQLFKHESWRVDAVGVDGQSSDGEQHIDGADSMALD